MKIELDTIYNMDCLLAMKDIPDNSVDLIITDPPYIMDTHGAGARPLAKRCNKRNKSIAFIARGFDYNRVFAEFLRVCKIPNIIIFCSNKQISQTMGYFEEKGLATTLLIWQKSNPTPTGNNIYISDCEFAIYVRGKGATFNNDVPLHWKKKIFTSPTKPDGETLHPTQKPIELLRRYLLIHSNENDVILDPFMGSGSTAIACILENRRFIGFEIDEEFYRIAQDRIKQEQQQLTLF